ncbi:MAG TPA: TMEM175 family protein [Flavisolibacter sp.]|jgi:uncharacterized membrane protein|nr:TMEM175 family protein [Flavisolibacter sp.]
MSAETNQLKETARIEAFSDGIFGVAITLLAIEISVEAHAAATDASLAHSLFSLWPKYLTYLMSFISVLLAWMGHHELFKKLRDTDKAVHLSNGFLLLLVALAPFPTRTLGLHILTGAFKMAAVFYTGYFVLVSIAFKLLWHAASRKRNLLLPSISESEIRKMTRNENLGLAFNCLVTLAACFYPWLGILLSFGMWLFWIF